MASIPRAEAIRLAEETLAYRVKSHAEMAQVLARYVVTDEQEREKVFADCRAAVEKLLACEARCQALEARIAELEHELIQTRLRMMEHP